MTADGDGQPVLRLAMVINWPDLGGWIWDYLPEDARGNQTELIFASRDHDDYVAGRGKLPPYLLELCSLARRRPRWNDYDVIFAWELRTILAVALLRRLTGQRRAKFVALQPILKGPVLKALPFLRWALADADRIVNFSTTECDANAALLRLPRDRFTFLPMTWPESAPITDNGGGFILAFGRSNRDYPLLLDAVRGADLPVTILAGDLDWAKGLDVPTNVTLQAGLSYDDTSALLNDSTFWVIPLKAVGYSSGQSVLLQGMARGKAVVVTDGPSVRDYVRDGETAVLVPPDDAPALRDALTGLWTDDERRARIGTNAAKAVREDFGYARFACSLVAMAEELVGRQSGVTARTEER